VFSGKSAGAEKKIAFGAVRAEPPKSGEEKLPVSHESASTWAKAWQVGQSAEWAAADPPQSRQGLANRVGGASVIPATWKRWTPGKG
jgi:hypothetical protein